MAAKETKATYSPGLAGVIAGETEICWVDPNAGLAYRGYDIHKMAEEASFEEVAHLLLKGELPDAEQLSKFTREIAAARSVPKQVLDALRLMPKDVHPMDMLRTGVSMLGPFDSELNDHSHAANIRKAIRLIAKVSTLITDGYRIAHNEDPLPERENLTMAGNFFYKLRGEVPQDWQIRMLDTIFILYADHEFNASTFAARVTASTLADIYAAVTSACGTLKGPLHGGANEDVMKMLLEAGSADKALDMVKNRLANKIKIPGFGHRVYHTTDPRATHLKALSEEIGQRTGHVDLYLTSKQIEQYMKESKNLNANVDFYSASTYYSLGIPIDLFTPIFAVSRMSGWTAHVLEQYRNNRLIRPRVEYTGLPVGQPWVEISAR